MCPDEKTTTTTSSSSSSLTVADRLKEYIPPPAIDRSIIFGIGIILYVLGTIWSPLILIVTYIASVCLSQWIRVSDNATERRKLLHEFDWNQPDFLAKYRAIPSTMTLKEGYWMNSRGMCLFYNILKPADETKIKAIVCFCHGYCDSPVNSKRSELKRLVQQGIGLIMLEIEGHGRSDGASSLIKDRNKVIDDLSTFFPKIIKEEFPPHLKCFLLGESLGGALAFCTYKRIPDQFSGVIFLAPMCKIADEVMPSKFVVDLCRLISGSTGTCTTLGYLPIAPVRNNMEKFMCHVAKKRVLVTTYPNNFARNPRMATARELIDMTIDISNEIPTFDAPFLVIHGKKDMITDPKLSQYLYDNASSKDKSIKLYKEFWHSMTIGETDEDVDMLFNDISDWILKRI